MRSAPDLVSSSNRARPYCPGRSSRSGFGYVSCRPRGAGGRIHRPVDGPHAAGVRVEAAVGQRELDAAGAGALRLLALRLLKALRLPLGETQVIGFGRRHAEENRIDL